MSAYYLWLWLLIVHIVTLVFILLFLHILLLWDCVRCCICRTFANTSECSFFQFITARKLNFLKVINFSKVGTLFKIIESFFGNKSVFLFLEARDSCLSDTLGWVLEFWVQISPSHPEIHPLHTKTVSFPEKNIII